MDLVSFDMRFLSFIRNQFLIKTFWLFVFNNSFFNERTEEKEVQLFFCFDWQNRLFHVCFSCVLKSPIVTNITLEEVLSKMNCNCMLWEKLWDFSPIYLSFMCFNNNLKTVIVTNMTLEHGLYKMNCKCVF